MRMIFWIVAAMLTPQFASRPTPLLAGQAASSSKAVLDYDYFTTQVQPIFLTKRPGYTRCVVCHSSGGAVGFLEPLSAGATTWNAEQSRKNFERVSGMVTPGDPMKSLLLRHPLEPAAGGDEFHTGGRQFQSQDDPQFKTLAAWVRGQTAGGAGK